MSVLVDTSMWVEYFRGGERADVVDRLVEENLIVANDLILSELLPPLHLRKERTLIALLGAIQRLAISIDWDDIVQMQVICLRNGIKGVGISDLIITQNAIQNSLQLLSCDRHFALMSRRVPLAIYGRG